MHTHTHILVPSIDCGLQLCDRGLILLSNALQFSLGLFLLELIISLCGLCRLCSAHGGMYEQQKPGEYVANSKSMSVLCTP